MKIKFGSDLLDFYTLGHLLSDLHELVVFSDLIEKNDLESIKSTFSNNFVFKPTRYTKTIRERRNLTEIVKFSQGSLEVIIPVSTLVASVIIPFVIELVKRALARNDEHIVFEFSVGDERLNAILIAFFNGDLGKGEYGLNTLTKALASNDYNVHIISKNIYSIEHITNRYAQRIVKTIKKY